MSGAVPPSPGYSRRTLGLGILLLTASIWIAASFISEALVKPTGGKGTASVHPFLLTYLATSLFTLYLPLLSIKSWVTDAISARPDGATPRPAVAIKAKADKVPMHAAAWCLPFWFTAQLTFNASLALTSVTSNTIISSTSSLFTFFLSIIFLGESFTTKKLLSILACIAGTALVTLSDAEGETGSNSHFLGDALTLGSSCMYAAYTVILRVKMPGEEAEAQLAQFFGYIGLFSTVFLAPVLVLLVAMEVITLSTIPKEVYFVIFLEGLLAYVLSDYLWARAIVLLGPTIATLGLSVQIPMAATVELLLGRASWIHSAQTLLMTLGGTSLILVGFFSLNLSDGDSSAPSPVSAGAQSAPLGQGWGPGDVQNDETQGLLSAAEQRSEVEKVDTAAAGGLHSHGNESGLPENWAKSVMGKLGRGWSNRSSGDSDLELKTC